MISDGNLRQIPGTFGTNVNAWKHNGKEVAYVVKQVPCMVSVMRLDPSEPDREISAVMATFNELIGIEDWRLTLRKQDCLAIYSEDELEYFRLMNKSILDSKLIRIISVVEMDRIDGTVLSMAATPVSGEL